MNVIICQDINHKNHYEYCRSRIESISGDQVAYNSTIFSKLPFSQIEKDLEETFEKTDGSHHFPQETWKKEDVNLEQASSLKI